MKNQTQQPEPDEQQLAASTSEKGAPPSNEDAPVNDLALPETLGSEGKEDAQALEWTLDDVPDDTADAVQEEMFTLKHLGTTLQVTREEVIALAQKGCDYDRVRSRLEDLTEQVQQMSELAEFVTQTAKRLGLAPEDLVDRSRAELLSKTNGIAYSAALRRVADERAARNSPDEFGKLRRRARNAEIHDFISEYGRQIDPATIPAEVWLDVKNGKPLTSAYRCYENRLLRERLQSDENRARAVTSTHSVGGTPLPGEIEQNWYKG